MISHLSFQEFQHRMKYHTKVGDPILKLTPFLLFTIFTQSGKIFYGGYNGSDFELTKNAAFWPIPYIIKGTYKEKSKSETGVSYQLTTVKTYYWGIRIFFLLFLFFVNFLLFRGADSSFLLVATIINLMLIPFLSIVLLVENQMKKRMERRFREIFRIEE